MNAWLTLKESPPSPARMMRGGVNRLLCILSSPVRKVPLFRPVLSQHHSVGIRLFRHSQGQPIHVLRIYSMIQSHAHSQCNESSIACRRMSPRSFQHQSQRRHDDSRSILSSVAFRLVHHTSTSTYRRLSLRMFVYRILFSYFHLHLLFFGPTSSLSVSVIPTWGVSSISMLSGFTPYFA